MAGVYEFVISLRNQSTAVAEKISSGVAGIQSVAGKASDAMSKMQAKTQSAFSKIMSSAITAVKGPNTLKLSVNELKEKLDALNKVKFATNIKSEFDAVNKEIKKTEKQLSRLEQGISGKGLGSKMKGWRQDFVNSLPGADLMKNPLTLAGAAVGGLWTSVQKSMEAGKEKVKMQTLTGSAEIGSALYNGLTKFATDTVFGNEVYDMGAQMLANGIKSSDVLPVMEQLGDISMGDSEKLGQLSLAFAQINGKGHLAGQELLQMINAGFNPLQVISEKTGESMESLSKKMEKGEISVADVRKAMDMATGKGGKFYGMLNKVANTPYGQLENLKGQLEQMMIKIGSVFLPIASKMMTFFSWIGEKLGPLLEPIALVLGVISVGLLAAAAAQWVLNLAFLANPVTWIIIGVIALIAVITWLISKISGWGEAWKIVTNNAKLIWDVFAAGAKMEWEIFINGFMIGLDKIKEGWYRFKNAVGIGDESENNAALKEISEDVKKRADTVGKSQKDFAEKLNALKKDSKNPLDALKWNKDSSLSDGIDKMKKTLGIDTKKKDTKTKDDEKNKLTETSREKSNGIASGGSKQTNIVINIQNLGTDTKVYVSSVKEGVSNLGDNIKEALLRAVNSVNQIQS